MDSLYVLSRVPDTQGPWMYLLDSVHTFVTKTTMHCWIHSDGLLTYSGVSQVLD